MKCYKQIIFTILFVCLATAMNSSNLKVRDVPPRNLVVDRTSDPTLHHVIVRDPTLTVLTNQTPVQRVTTDNSIMHFGNSSDNNGPDVGGTVYGKAAEIAGPAIIVHSKGSLSVLQEQPAHVGWRNEKKVITSMNKATSIFL